MSVTFKLILTAVVGLLLAIVVFVVDRGDRGFADAGFWRGGERDPVRQMLVGRDGTLGRYTKPLAATFLIAFLGVIWLLF
jgi:hypothetical protein